MNRKLDTYSMTKMALCLSVLCVSSYLVIHLPFTPIVLSAHTIVVNIIGLILPPWQAASTIFVYLVMGLVGLPVFSGGSSGPAKLFGPTGGFYFGFLLAVFAISIISGKKQSILNYCLATILVGTPIQHIMAIIFMCFYNGFNVTSAAMTVSVPFIPGDFIKCVIASAIALGINRALQRRPR